MEVNESQSQGGRVVSKIAQTLNSMRSKLKSEEHEAGAHQSLAIFNMTDQRMKKPSHYEDGIGWQEAVVGDCCKIG